MSKDKFEAKGLIIFFVSKNDELFTVEFDKDYYTEMYKQYGEIGKQMLADKYERDFTFDIYHLISGKEFLDCVKCSGFTNYDGYIKEVYVNGFKSNVGLISDNLISGGDFYMDEDAWRNLCEDYDVKVNWVNK